MADYSYRIAATHNVALASMNNVEEISQIGYPPRSRPVNVYPQRVKTLNGKVHGDGEVIHEWVWDFLPMTALTHVITTYLTSGGSQLSSAPVTIYTRRRELGTDEYRRYNCYLELPMEGDHYTLDGDTALDVRLRFHGLVAI